VRVRRGFQRHGMLGDAGCSKVIGHAADRDDQRVIPDRARRRNLLPVFIYGSREMHLRLARSMPVIAPTW